MERQISRQVRAWAIPLIICLLGLNLIPAAEMAPLSSTIIEIYPGDSFENSAEGLLPGDTLIVHEGTYIEDGYITLSVQGTAEEPVTITGAEGEARPHLTMTLPSQNNLNITGAAFLKIQGLEISDGAHAIRITGSAAHITLVDLVLHDVDTGISLWGDMHHIHVIGNHIYDTVGQGEGVLIGCNNADCVVSESVIKGNWIHDTLGSSQGEGIDLKEGSHSNIVQDNVIYNTNYPCILLYGTAGGAQNLVDGNIVWNCGDSGIRVAADAVIQNNIIMDIVGNGIQSTVHQSSTPQHLHILHNTIVNADTCLRLYDWYGAPDMILANNAIYCDSGTNIMHHGLEGVTISGNVIYPGYPDIGISGRSTPLDFLNAAAKDVYPSIDSPLIDAGDPLYSIEYDFNGTLRTIPPDAGAYNWTGPTNPGFPIEEGFKKLLYWIFLPLISHDLT